MLRTTKVDIEKIKRTLKSAVMFAAIVLVVAHASHAATTAASTTFSPIRVHSGGSAYTDSLGQVWSADKDFRGGGTYAVSSSIANTNDPKLYKTERWGSFTYTFPASAGTYAVTLKFAETSFTGPGQRVFNVAINGATVLANFDIFSQAGGANIALDKTFTVAASGGSIKIQFMLGSADDPKVDGIQVVSTSQAAPQSQPSVVAPAITSQPSGKTVAAGQTASFSVAATGTAPMTFQWQKNGVAVSGATSSTYTTTPMTTSDSGAMFSAVVSNSAGTATSNGAMLTVTSATVAPSITTQPASKTVTAGQTASFSVAATGTAPMTYQWSMNGVAIGGATSSTYTTPATTSSSNNESFTVTVANSAGTAGSNAATLTVGTASTALLNASVTSMSFGSVNVSSNSIQNVTLTNAGNSNVTISNVSVSGAGFNPSGVSSGLILTPGQTVQMAVTFAPAATGSVTGSVTVSSNATNSPDSIALSGTGASSVQHSVALSWTASTSSVVGYNTYSSTVSGGPYVKLTSSPVASMSYTDSTVQAGNTYYYVVTSVNSQNVESLETPEVSAIVP